MPNKDSEVEVPRDAVAVREFFNRWSLYCRIVDNDYLYHQSVLKAFADWLDRFEGSFSFLDLGCGDAKFSSKLLKGRALISYTGIDLSPVALGLAEENIHDLGVPCTLMVDDFMIRLASLAGFYDIIYIGLSMHHLRREEKEYFFAQLHGRLAPGGVLIVFDRVLTPGESRESYMGRWVDHAEWAWKALTKEEVEGAVEHVTTSDFPEEITTLNSMATRAGFHPAQILFIDRTDFYALMVFQAK